MPKFFSNDIVGDVITFDSDDSKHIKTVLRADIGERLTVCDGEGFDYLCEVSSLDGSVKANIIEKTPCKSEPKVKVTLFQGLPKGDKMEAIIQKCVEIGICEIVPVSCERSIVKIEKKEDKKIARWQKISLSAAKQSGRGIVPVVSNSLSFKEAVKKATEMDLAIIPYENEKEVGIRQAIDRFEGKTISVFIGPEGGFSDDEISFALENGVKSVTLGRRILRTETAGPVATAILMYELD